jgi:hypothetical protein
MKCRAGELKLKSELTENCSPLNHRTVFSRLDHSALSADRETVTVARRQVTAGAYPVVRAARTSKWRRENAPAEFRGARACPGKAHDPRLAGKGAGEIAGPAGRTPLPPG